MMLFFRGLLIAFLSVALHIVAGWIWTPAAGVAAGITTPRRGWLVGMLGVAAGWAAIVAYSYTVAPAPTAEMARIFGSLMGNLPGAATVAATVLIGAILGALGGLVGSLIIAASARHSQRAIA